MYTIKQILKITKQNPTWWNYYRGNYNSDIFTPAGCEDFVRFFFDKSGKAEPFHYFQSVCKTLPPERREHIAYVFLLGIYIYNNSSIKKELDNEIQKLNRRTKKTDIRFEFVWFLICMFHDLVHSKESELDIKQLEDVNKLNLRTISGVPKIFNGLPIRYYYYRRLQAKNDHGVYAGVLMFDQLCKIRKKQEKIIAEDYANQVVTICWEKSLEKIYNYVAWIIACHNMWFKHANNPKECLDCTLYRLFGLNNLILFDDGKEYKKKCRKYPFFVTTQVHHYHHRKVNGKHMFPFRLRIAYDSNSLL